jgi:hypothetical protein
MINCEEYERISKVIGLDQVKPNISDKILIAKLSLIFKMLRRDEIGPEWFFSLMHDLGIYTGWYESILERGDGS